MGLVFECGCMDLLTILFSIVICFITYLKWSFGYWERKKVPYLKPHLLWGTLGNPFTSTKSFGEVTKEQYQKAKHDGNQIIGLFAFSKPICMIIDPHIIKSIMATDFKYFMNRGVYYNEKDDPLSAHLFSIEGNKWKNLRAKLTPTFTTGKMKTMFNVVRECGDQLKEVVDEHCIQKEPIDIKDILARFSTNVIGSTAFGLDCNTFSNPNSEFRLYGNKVFEYSRARSLKDLFSFISPSLSRRLGVTITDADVTNFFMQVIKQTVEYREEHNVIRNDFMQLLINMKNGAQDNVEQEYNHDGKSLTFNELAAQAYVFFIAGFETSSTTMTHCLFELAVNPDIQAKLRCEIQQVLAKHNGQITYEAITDMKYMGQVLDETLRKYPTLPILNRICNEDYKIPGTEIVIEKGTPVFLPITGLHKDSEYYPNPEVFDPERFSDENKHDIVPYTYMPFGEGPRICIGLRFGMMQMKIGLTVLLKNFKLSLNNRTKTPLKWDPKSFFPRVVGDVLLDVEKVQ